MLKNLKNYVNTFFVNKRSLHQKPAKPGINQGIITMIIIMALVIVVVILLAAAEGQHYYMISKGV